MSNSYDQSKVYFVHILYFQSYFWHKNVSKMVGAAFEMTSSQEYTFPNASNKFWTYFEARYLSMLAKNCFYTKCQPIKWKFLIDEWRCFFRIYFEYWFSYKSMSNDCFWNNVMSWVHLFECIQLILNIFRS